IQVNVPLHSWMVQDVRGLQAVANALREPVQNR
ncbi:MAG: lipase, partial [Candidatus Parcubacteria bacterium]|nr:lipase [Leptolyngbyaceae cyanobacterium LF-bin-113]